MIDDSPENFGTLVKGQGVPILIGPGLTNNNPEIKFVNEHDYQVIDAGALNRAPPTTVVESSVFTPSYTDITKQTQIRRWIYG